ncbi:TonB-dependent receptor [Magnetospirillum aberrantis]|uniref:TonB-dependent receptor plug domain-containing protein n=1 Tax=Magnetospirillum aberrantis SpK TaxID=908842 RepID=A0A7C9UX65_9PROT|nr:TonB-dependent receptor plug domain-containing protein [Magnetospirillum aberrantis]NFV78915.1 TonB-dependent receptor plug domain-containing protein [Magnetospirillum aberrantis SpK]
MIDRLQRGSRATSCALIALALALPASALAQSAVELPPVPVDTAEPEPQATLGTTEISGDELKAKQKASGDTADLLKGVPGVSLYSAGGASSLPVIHGLADDRLNVRVNDMPITSSCPNHMNPALSYISPTQVGTIEVLPGVTPVSYGGDSIGGTIKVETPDPKFAAPGEDLLTTGQMFLNYSSNAHAFTTGGDITAATENVSAKYSGSWTRAGDYHRGGDGAPQQTSRYGIQDHAVTVAARKDGDLLEAQVGYQFQPYQGYPNQRMDLTDNESMFGNLRYKGQFGWGRLDASAYLRHVEHEMNFIGAVKSSSTMPMNTESDEFGYNLKGDIPLNQKDTLRVGNEFQRYTLDDWWPPTSNTANGGMSPEDFWNINDGERNRIGTFAEWERKWTPQWTSLLGIRNDTVWMDTSTAKGYSNNNNAGISYLSDAAAFNAQNHAKTDVNFDLTALLKYEHDKSAAYEVGYARKTRSPNLYERYAWSTGSMASTMTTWFGDGNGYVGDINLSPEVAHTLSVSGDWHDPAKKVWGIKVSPYYTYVQDYIDADKMWDYTVPNANWSGYSLYKFANHDAEMFGIDISGNRELWDDLDWGRYVFTGSLSWVRGRNLDTGDNLYNIMPLNARLGVDHKLGGWSNGIEVEAVASKDFVSSNRHENTTPAYALLNLRTAYEWDNLILSAGIDNVFDKRYHLPLGGADLAYRSPKPQGSNVYGMGRSFLAGMTLKF